MRTQAPSLLGIAALTVFLLAAAPAARSFDLSEMSDRFDRDASVELDRYLKKANACSTSYDFQCSEKNLAKAKKLAFDKAQREDFANAEKFLALKREEKAAEERRVEEERRLAEERRIAEEKRRAEEEAEAARRYENELKLEQARERERLRQEREEEERAEMEREARRQEEAMAEREEERQALFSAMKGAMEGLGRDVALAERKAPSNDLETTARKLREELERRERAESQRRAEAQAVEARQTRERQERERQERARTASARSLPSSGGSAGASGANGAASRSAQQSQERPIAIFITYRNPHGYWFTWGPYNETSGEGEKRGERESWQVIIGDEPATFVGQLGRYNLWKLHRALRPWEKDLRGRLHGEGLSPEALDSTL